MNKIDRIKWIKHSTAQEREVLSKLDDFADQFALDMNCLVNTEPEHHTARGTLWGASLVHLYWAAWNYRLFCAHHDYTPIEEALTQNALTMLRAINKAFDQESMGAAQ